MLDAKCRGYIARLENTGVLSPGARETVIDRMLALAADTDESAEIDQLKWVIMMVLSSNDHEYAYARMEALLHAESPGASH